MAYAQSYGMGPNAQYNDESMFRRGGYGGEGGGDRYSGTGPSNDNYNMGVQSPYSPPNNGGPGNPGTANNMPRPTLPRFQQFQNNKGPAPLTPQDRAMQQMSGQISGMQLPQDFNPWSGGFGQGGSNQGASDARQGMQNQYTGDPRHLYEQQRQTNNPLNQFGYGGQSQSLGRYVPPMMTNPNDLNAWNNQGGYAYNIPNSYGSGQWNQFNSRDVAFPNFGQSQNVPTPRLNPGNPPPSYQSPFGRPDPQRQQNYLAYMMNLTQGGQAQSNSTQPGAPDQAGPVT